MKCRFGKRITSLLKFLFLWNDKRYQDFWNNERAQAYLNLTASHFTHTEQGREATVSFQKYFHFNIVPSFSAPKPWAKGEESKQ